MDNIIKESVYYRTFSNYFGLEKISIAHVNDKESKTKIL